MMLVFNNDLALNQKIIHKNQALHYCLKISNLNKNATRFKIRSGFM